MASDLYRKLSDLNLLRRAWHLAREDARNDFIEDPLQYADYAARLDDYLQAIADALADGSYHPKALSRIDVPKSSLSVRPGSVVSIDDHIVLFAVACLIAPHLDKKLPDNVYSWRVKKGKGRRLFHDHEILKFPFLRRQTIRRRLVFVEPWYAAWPRFGRDIALAYEREGFECMVVSDIVAYFENIHLGILRDLLLQHLPGQNRIVTFLINLLEYWAWPTAHGGEAPLGIPQGNGVSSFLGNIYLLPLDQAFVRFGRRHDIRYLRYMDDVKVLTKGHAAARAALFLMNETLRMLRLNIQGAKTRILLGRGIRDELLDPRIEDVNRLIKETQKRSRLSAADVTRLSGELRRQLKRVRRRQGIIRDKELRLYRRIMTGFALLRRPEILDSVLKQLARNPDYRLLDSADRYLRTQVRNRCKIAAGLLAILSHGDELFPYQQGRLLGLLRYVRNVPPEGWQLACRLLRRKSTHWYVRQQAAMLLSMKPLQKREMQGIRRLFDAERKVQVKRALAQALAQLPGDELERFVRKLVFAPQPPLQRVGRLYHDMLFNPEAGQQQIASYFRYAENEHALLERLFEPEVLSKARTDVVKQTLLRQIRQRAPAIRHPLLRERLFCIARRLAAR